MAGQTIQLNEGILIQQGQDPLAGGQLAFGVGFLDRGLAHRMQRLLGALTQIGQLAGRRMDIRFGNARHG